MHVFYKNVIFSTKKITIHYNPQPLTRVKSTRLQKKEAEKIRLRKVYTGFMLIICLLSAGFMLFRKCSAGRRG